MENFEYVVIYAPAQGILGNSGCSVTYLTSVDERFYVIGTHLIRQKSNIANLQLKVKCLLMGLKLDNMLLKKLIWCMFSNQRR